MVIDEADQLIFGDPLSFFDKTKLAKCICLTGTVDNGDPQGIERDLLSKLGFAIYNDPRMIAQPPFAFNVALPSKTNDALLAFVLDAIKSRAVLIYCASDFTNELVKA